MAEGFLGWFKRRSGKPGPSPMGKAIDTIGAHQAEHERQRNEFEMSDEDLPLADELSATERDVYEGQLIFATSSNVHQWKYLGPELKLYVQFKSGGTYVYYDVPFSVALEFFRTDSPGRFVHWHLKNKYRYLKIGEMPPEKYHNVVTTLD